MSSWLGQFHDFTKKYDPLGHELVNGMWKSSTGIVNESSRAMQKLGDKWGINTKIPEYGKNLSAKDKGSFNRWGENTIGGVGAVLGGGYALGGEAAGGAGAGGIGEVGAGGLGTLGGGVGGGGASSIGGGGAAAGASGMPLGAGGYAEAGGGYVADAPGGGFSWLNGDGTSGMTGLLGQGGSSGGLMQQLAQQGGSGGGQQGGQQQGGATGGTMLGNPALTAALAKLVEDDERAKREQQGEIMPPEQGDQGNGIFGLTADDIQRLLAMYQQQQQQNGGGYGYGSA